MSVHLPTIARKTGKCFVCGRSTKLHVHSDCHKNAPKNRTYTQKIRKAYLRGTAFSHIAKSSPLND